MDVNNNERREFLPFFRLLLFHLIETVSALMSEPSIGKHLYTPETFDQEMTEQFSPSNEFITRNSIQRLLHESLLTKTSQFEHQTNGFWKTYGEGPDICIVTSRLLVIKVCLMERMKEIGFAAVRMEWRNS